MFRTGNRFIAKTMVFGGVATGIMNPQLAARTVALKRVIGSAPMPEAALIRIGSMVVAVATLLAISETATTKITTQVNNSQVGIPRSEEAA
jgi:hypothetical protein